MYTYSQHQFLKPVRVAGVRLVPFTLGHADVLCGLDSPVYRGEVPVPEDLAVALFVCSRPWKKAARQIRSGRASRIMTRLGRRFGKMDPEDAAVICELFADYISTYRAAPPRWEDGGEKGQARAPWHLSVFTLLQHKTNFQALETWNLPVSRAFELAAVIGANHGDDKLVSPAEMEVYKTLMAADEAPIKPPPASDPEQPAT